MPRGRPPKYAPLAAYLAQHTGGRVTLTFTAIEQIIGAPLPPSARRALFWANLRSMWGGSAQAWAWRRAGWRVASRNLHGRPPAVTFARLPADMIHQPLAPPHRPSAEDA